MRKSLLVVVALAALAGCQTGGGQPPPPGQITPSTQATTLGDAWVRCVDTAYGRARQTSNSTRAADTAYASCRTQETAFASSLLSREATPQDRANLIARYREELTPALVRKWG